MIVRRCCANALYYRRVLLERRHGLSRLPASAATTCAICVSRSAPARCVLPSHRLVPSHRSSYDARRRCPDRRARCATSTTSTTRLLIVATDRISAFDYVLGSGIPDKGKVLTQLSAFWFGGPAHIVPNHCRSTMDVDAYPAAARPYAAQLRGRSMLVAKTEPFRSSAWRAATCPARAGRTISRPARSAASRCRRACASPTGCPSRSSRPPPRPTSGHDVNISEDEAARLVGGRDSSRACATDARALRARRRARRARGIILADTKFEFGLHATSGRAAC